MSSLLFVDLFVARQKHYFDCLYVPWIYSKFTKKTKKKTKSLNRMFESLNFIHETASYRKGNTFIVMHYCYHFQHHSKVPVLLRQPVYSSSMEVNPSEHARVRLCSVFRYSLVVKKVRLQIWLTVVYVTSYLFSSSYSPCITEKPLNMWQNRSLSLNCTPAAAQKEM